MQSNANVLQVENIITRFNTQDGKVFAVNGISFDLKEGELLGVVGESGSGKSVTMMSLLKLLPMPPAEIVEGRALFENQDLIQMDLNQLRKIRGGKIGFIFQDPMTSLNPVLTVGYQLMEPMREHLGLSREEARKKAIELLDLVGIPMAQSRLKDFPHQFSGGMRQRIMIAMALQCNPSLLIADEPTTALDVVIQDQILNEIRKVQEVLGLSLIYISHDIAVIAEMTDNMAVMYAGRIVERGPTKEIFANPRHSYTKSLLDSTPSVVGDKVKLKSLEGEPPSLINKDPGCSFAPRCPYREESCNPSLDMELVEIGTDHYVDICSAGKS